MDEGPGTRPSERVNRGRQSCGPVPASVTRNPPPRLHKRQAALWSLWRRRVYECVRARVRVCTHTDISDGGVLGPLCQAGGHVFSSLVFLGSSLLRCNFLSSKNCGVVWTRVF